MQYWHALSAAHFDCGRSSFSQLGCAPTFYIRWLEDTCGDDYHFPLDANTLREMFADVTQQIIVKTRELIKRAAKQPDTILLVGGLGSNPYLKQKIQDAFAADVIVPAHGYAANLIGV